MGNRKGATQKTRSKAAVRQQTLFDLFPKQVAPVSCISDVESDVERLQESPPDVRSITATSVVEEHENITSTHAVVKKLRMVSLEARPMHPFFAKRVDRASPVPPEEIVTSDDDITVLEVSAASSNQNLSQTNSIALSQDGGSRDDPIILDSSPVKLRPTIHQVAGSMPLAPIFAPRPKKDPPPSTSMPKAVDAPYPSRDLQHVRGPQQTFSPRDPIYPRRSKAWPADPIKFADHHNRLSPNLNISPFEQLAPRLSPPQEQETNVALEATANEAQTHPGIVRFRTDHPASNSNNLWVDKWHPRRADEVLGNESNATYLRDWLRALELQLSTDTLPGSSTAGRTKTKDDISRKKRPRVVRVVERTRSRKKRRTDSDDETDWIVDSDESEEEVVRSKEADIDSDAPSLSRLRRRNSDEYLPSPKRPVREDPNDLLSDTLTNTILLAGPPGTGKTAAVYACAEELGWEVFEVYPGIGKRNGASLENLVGDVGKNHHVKSGVSIIKGRNPLSTLPWNNATMSMEDDSSRVDGDSGSSTESVSSGIRQSVVLLEEVDILFKEDANFWPAVINFIKDCKRPVICTCNDVSLVPILDLPIQAVLNFQPCGASLAAAYLQSLCLAEGYSVQQSAVLQLYISGSGVDRGDSEDAILHLVPGNDGVPDLRQTINHLQFRCSSTYVKTEHSDKRQLLVDSIDNLWDPVTLNDSSIDEKIPPTVIANHAELLSFMDSHLMRGAWNTPAALALSGCEPSADDEIGHSIFFYPRKTSCSELFTSDTRDEEIIGAALRLSRGPLGTEYRGQETRDLFRHRVDYQRQVADALRRSLPLSVLTLCRSDVVTDYLPRVRDIVIAEDMQEALSGAKERPGRTTRNSMRGVYERNLVFSAEERVLLEMTRLS